MKEKYEMFFPWEEPPLDGWLIVGMNHYYVNRIKCLFVAMVKGNVCIKAEGPCEELVFINLRRQAKAAWNSDGEKRCFSCGSTNLEHDGTCRDC